MLDGLLLKTEFHQDGNMWYLTAGNLILATIILKEFVNFSKYVVSYKELWIDGKVQSVPRELSNKRTLEDAKMSIRAHLKIE